MNKQKQGLFSSGDPVGQQYAPVTGQEIQLQGWGQQCEELVTESSVVVQIFSIYIIKIQNILPCVLQRVELQVNWR